MSERVWEWRWQRLEVAQLGGAMGIAACEFHSVSPIELGTMPSACLAFATPRAVTCVGAQAGRHPEEKIATVLRVHCH